MKQVIKNLLINSIEAIGEKKGKITIGARALGKDIRIAIRDNGVGLSRRELDLIFREDYSRKEAGTGLGLFIVKRIVDLHKGDIQFKSRKAQGTTVTLFLPDCLENH
jgi:signal transduction histidine kinase